MGDFYRYTIGENSNSFDWSNVPLLKNKKSRETIFREFNDTITKKQEIPWQNYYNMITDKESFRRIKKENRKKAFGFTFDDDKIDDVINDYKKYFFKLLSIKQKRGFSKYIESYLEDYYPRKYTREGLNLKQLANWIIKKVLIGVDCRKNWKF